jgi:GNAT superfamily N-acetyltransferase
MIEICLVQQESDLEQVYQLNLQNLKGNISATEAKQEGFVTWLYSPQLLLQMHRLAPSLVAKEGDQVVGYALVTPKEASAFHPDLQEMFASLRNLDYKGKKLFDHNFYCMGQVCIAKEYRGKGIFEKLYEGHYQYYHKQYDLLVTEISVNNLRSQKAHEQVGFTTIYKHRDHMDDWNVVVWDWR